MKGPEDPAGHKPSKSCRDPGHDDERDAGLDEQLPKGIRSDLFGSLVEDRVRLTPFRWRSAVLGRREGRGADAGFDACPEMLGESVVEAPLHEEVIEGEQHPACQ